MAPPIADGGGLAAPTLETAAQLAVWMPPGGVISLYLDLDPADRGEGWQIELRNGLRAAEGAADGDGRETRLALEETSKRLERDLEESWETRTRALIGYVEVSREPGEERWYATQLPPRDTVVRHGPVAHLSPLLTLLDDGAPLGVAAVASERVRLLHWRLGRVSELHDWELEFFASAWRERKSQRPTDPGHGSAVSSSGRDQHHQRLEANRERFANQTGELAGTEAKEHGWRELLVFGDERYVRHFAEGCKRGPETRHLDGADLITEPTAAIERRVETAIPNLNRERERLLVERIKEAAYAEGRSALGVQETLQALAEGRVEHLVYDAERDYAEVGLQTAAPAGVEGMPLEERMIEMALSTGAAITPAEGAGAEALADQGGVAALLRY